MLKSEIKQSDVYQTTARKKKTVFIANDDEIHFNPFKNEITFMD